METYGKILVIAMPVFLALVLLEKWYGWKKGFDTVRNMDMVSSLSSGITNVTKDVLGLSITIVGYSWLVKHVALLEIKATWLTYVIAFIALDFAGYWVHRLSHEINLFWNKHLVHHSSEEFNLACALRQSISSFFNIWSFFLLPAAFLGVPAQVIAFLAPLHLFAQFWYHTRHIGKMGFLEHIIVTPSHHRVHHAINPEYIDKNHSQIFIVWDKLFGTFQEELPDVPPVYGITRPVSTWNPIKINFQHLWLLIMDAWRTQSWKEKFLLWWKPTGYRPADVAEKYPIKKIDDVYHFEKYAPTVSPLVEMWAWVQMTVLLLMLTYFFGNIATIGMPSIFYYGAFVFMMVYAYTELMDGNPLSGIYELLKNLFGAGIIIYSGDWFGISSKYPWALSIIVAYLFGSTLVTGYLAWQQYKNRTETEAAIASS
ncbi:MAG: sterol desaturase family protein [Chitinophagaceae bacterium]|nr:sterol desaturase family protein [Chitinophagaceae bacterium]MCU0405072.1 sterol desaturase family protein [Chitinophagaceae bacterium]